LDGLLIDENRPWLSALDIPRKSSVRSLAINAYIVELIHKRLFSFYEQIDFSNIRQPSVTPETGDERDDDRNDEILAISCLDLAAESETTSASLSKASMPTRRVLSMRLDKILRVLEKLGCEVRGGKGSETTVYYPGRNIYRLGHRREVPSAMANSVLKRLGISTQQWLSAVDQ
jgi:hypothetical protein